MRPHDGCDDAVGRATPRLVALLHNELRIARVAALDRGVDPAEMTTDIVERLRRLREANATT